MSSIAVLEQYLGAGKKVGKNEYEFMCPGNCGRHLCFNTEENVYFCVICGYLAANSIHPKQKMEDMRKGIWYGGGSIYHLMAYFKQDTTTLNVTAVKEVKKESNYSLSQFRLLMTEVFKHPELIQSHREYLFGRGFSSNYWTARNIQTDMGENPLGAMSSSIVYDRIKELTSPKERIDLNVDYENGKRLQWINYDRILLPYRYEEKGTVIAVRSRSVLSLNSKRYLWPPGTPASSITYVCNPAIDKNKPLLITEGEFKSALPALFGIQCWGQPGITSGHERLVLKILESGIKEVVICFDTENPNDCETEEKKLSKQRAFLAVENAYENIKTLMIDSGIKVNRFILPKEGSKTDLDSFILKNGPESLKLLLKKEGYNF